jgi:hypothetical protein
MAVTLWGQAPVLVTSPHAAILSWEQGDTSYILTESPTVDGLYTPSLEPMIFGGNRVTVVTTIPPMKFFKLAQGGQLLEDFSRGLNYAWTVTDGAEDYTITYANGALRIQADPGIEPLAIVFSPPTWESGNWPHCANVAMSVDILDWGENAIGQNIAFGARFRSNPGADDHGNGYWPRLTIKGGGSEQASFWNGELTNGQWNEVDAKSFDLGPKRPLRLVYSLAGGLHTTAVFDLSNPSEGAIDESRGSDSSYTEGLFCLWFGNGDNNPAPCDITIDNVIMTWTSP